MIFNEIMKLSKFLTLIRIFSSSIVPLFVQFLSATPKKPVIFKIHKGEQRISFYLKKKTTPTLMMTKDPVFFFISSFPPTDDD